MRARASNWVLGGMVLCAVSSAHSDVEASFLKERSHRGFVGEPVEAAWGVLGELSPEEVHASASLMWCLVACCCLSLPGGHQDQATLILEGRHRGPKSGGNLFSFTGSLQVPLRRVLYDRSKQLLWRNRVYGARRKEGASSTSYSDGDSRRT